MTSQLILLFTFSKLKKKLRTEKTNKMTTEHSLLELRKLIPQKTAEANRALNIAEKTPILRELQELWRERLTLQKSKDVEKELRTVEVLKPLYTTKKEGATPGKAASPSPKKKEDRKGGKPLPNPDRPLKGTKSVNIHSNNENVLNPRNADLRTNVSKECSVPQTVVKEPLAPSSPPQPPSSPLSEGEDDKSQPSPSKTQPEQAEPKGKGSRKKGGQQPKPAAGRGGATRKAPPATTPTTRNPQQAIR